MAKQSRGGAEAMVTGEQLEAAQEMAAAKVREEERAAEALAEAEERAAEALAEEEEKTAAQHPLLKQATIPDTTPHRVDDDQHFSQHQSSMPISANIIHERTKARETIAQTSKDHPGLVTVLTTNPRSQESIKNILSQQGINAISIKTEKNQMEKLIDTLKEVEVLPGIQGVFLKEILSKHNTFGLGQGTKRLETLEQEIRRIDI